MPLRRLLLYLGLASAGLMLTGSLSSVGAAAAIPALHITYKLVEKPAGCPHGTPAKSECVTLAGTALESGTHWPRMRRLAIVDGPAPALPADCDTATTRGVLAGKQGKIHFRAAGYYCPKSDTAFYRYTLETAAAARFGLPLHGTIRYLGSSNTETFASSTQ